ncbi:hypothetical protein B0H63DRAFT_558843 [Podospora didyma]|uniref:Heterokaryon incompatibility domain-containing protein n=1 Tax=Podospora didyma TaxID=330526 RepID=A0AAE0NTE8_9PEZI|nr:hypothetical protein B0H63DRAFT_558843 [Podospora didyma]
MPILERKVTTAIQNLLSRPWWTRVWIIQELVFGAMGTKISTGRLHCGEKSVMWMNLVVAAARIKAYQDDLRQLLPNISNVLELDSLREQALHFLSFSFVQRYFDVPWSILSMLDYKNPFPRTRLWGFVRSNTILQFPQLCKEARQTGKREKEIRLKWLEISINGFGFVNDLDEISRDFTFYSIPDNFKDDLQKMLVFNFLLPHLPIPKFQHGEELSILHVNGILWETIDECHSESFVEDVSTDWRETTRFMVAVGLCKALAVTHAGATERYLELEQRLEAFWSALFARQIIGADTFEADDESRERLCYAQWMAEIPLKWTPDVAPPVTATSTDLIEMAGMREGMKQSFSQLTSSQAGEDEDGDEKPGRRFQSVSMPFGDLDPKNWFMNVVLDPYWETREEQDELALRHTRERRGMPITSVPPSSMRGEGEENPEAEPEKLMAKYRAKLREVLYERPSMSPQATLEAGIEKYALGRRFFVTKGGYFGLGPKDTQAGDRVATLFGSGVPFVLRNTSVMRLGTIWGGS